MSVTEPSIAVKRRNVELRFAQVFAPPPQLTLWLGFAWLGLAWLGLAWLGNERQFIHSEVCNRQHTHQERSLQDRRYDARLPDHVASQTGETPARRASCSSTQHQSLPSQFPWGPPAKQPRSQWFIHRSRPTGGLVTTWQRSSISQSTPLNSPLRNNAIKPRPYLSPVRQLLTLINIYIYVWYCSCQPNTTLQYLHKFIS